MISIIYVVQCISLDEIVICLVFPIIFSGQELCDVMKKVEEMIVYEIDENEDDEKDVSIKTIGYY